MQGNESDDTLDGGADNDQVGGDVAYCLEGLAAVAIARGERILGRYCWVPRSVSEKGSGPLCTPTGPTSLFGSALWMPPGYD